jgi:hypothetical protein
MATTTQETGRHIALVDIRVPDNVRALDPEHVKALAGLDRAAGHARRFTDEDVDQARAAGVLIEFDGPCRPIIVDRPLYRELVKTAIKRTHDELDGRPPSRRRPRARPSSRRTP